MELRQFLQLAYSAERAAAFAYVGHAGSVKSPDIKREIKQIEDEEWRHRELLLGMMNRLGVRPSPFLEAKYYLIGKFISLSCYFLGYFLPMYFAGRLESGNVNEYVRLLELIENTPLADERDCVLEMALVEKNHELYFLSKVTDHPLLGPFMKVFKWGPGRSFNDFENKWTVVESVSVARS